MPDQNYYGDLIAPPDPSFGVRDNPVARGFAGALMDIARIPQRAFQASEAMRTGGNSQYNPGPVLNAAMLGMSGGLAAPTEGAALGAGPIRSATYSVGDKVFEGPNHVVAMDNALKGLGLDHYSDLIDLQPGKNLTEKLAAHQAADGFMTSDGRVVSRQEANALVGANKSENMTLGAGPTDKRGAALAAGTQGIRAYHGSPYDFDKFDLSKIGTGEGAQAYGHGLYFAENPATADEYRRKLSSGMGQLEGKKIPAYSDDPQMIAAERLSTYRLDKDAAIASLDRDIPFQSWEHNKQKLMAARAELENMSPKDVQLPGRGYEVSINADPEHFLDWDKPLSEQSQHVKGAMNPDFLASHGSKTMPQAYPYGVNDATAQSLRSAGIPGIKYLDQGSRGAGEGTRNYVVFDDSIVDILRKYGLVGTLGSGITAYDAKRNANK